VLALGALAVMAGVAARRQGRARRDSADPPR
jgi:hypothetical protein